MSELHRLGCESCGSYAGCSCDRDVVCIMCHRPWPARTDMDDNICPDCWDDVEADIERDELENGGEG